MVPHENSKKERHKKYKKTLKKETFLLLPYTPMFLIMPNFDKFLIKIF
jgi:hypothetical protein